MIENPSKRKRRAQPKKRNAYKNRFYVLDDPGTNSDKPERKTALEMAEDKLNDEDLVKLDTLPNFQFVEHIRFAMLIAGMDTLDNPELTLEQLDVTGLLKRKEPK